MINFRNTTDGICLIKFCYSLEDLTDFRIATNSTNENETESEIETMERNVEEFEGDQSMKLKNLMLNYVVFMINLDSISFSASTPHETIRGILKQNFYLANVWNISILYVIFFYFSKSKAIFLVSNYF